MASLAFPISGFAPHPWMSPGADRSVLKLPLGKRRFSFLVQCRLYRLNPPCMSTRLA